MGVISPCSPDACKIFEKGIHNQLYRHVQKNNLLNSSQSGFRPAHSTSRALIDVTDYVLSNMDNGLLTGAVFLDLKKAFDMVDRDILLGKLRTFGVSGNELALFKDYVTGRQQHVSTACGTTLSALPVSHGVPQGSIMGPLLFIMYINDISICVRHSKLVLYADDTAILFPGKNTTVIQQALQNDMVSIQ
jgi:hypothetical protein